MTLYAAVPIHITLVANIAGVMLPTYTSLSMGFEESFCGFGLSQTPHRRFVTEDYISHSMRWSCSNSGPEDRC